MDRQSRQKQIRCAGDLPDSQINAGATPALCRAQYMRDLSLASPDDLVATQRTVPWTQIEEPQSLPKRPIGYLEHIIARQPQQGRSGRSCDREDFLKSGAHPLVPLGCHTGRTIGSLVPPRTQASCLYGRTNDASIAHF